MVSPQQHVQYMFISFHRAWLGMPCHQVYMTNVYTLQHFLDSFKQLVSTVSRRGVKLTSQRSWAEKKK